MVRDIVPELLIAIDETFDNKNSKSRILKKSIKLLEDGNASYRDVNDLAVEVGRNMADSINENIEQQLLPDEKMYFNISNRLMNHTLKNNYDIVTGYAKDVQTQLNVSSGLHLKAQVPDFNQEKVKGLVERLTNAKNFESIEWILNEPIITFTQSIVDDSIQKNVDLQAKAGLQPRITRTVVGKACKWCQNLAGSYLYSEAPKDIYRRHERCRCVVNYYPGDGRHQNVWSKQWKDPNKDDKIRARKRLNIDVKSNNRKIDSVQFKKYLEALGNKSIPVSLAKFQELKYNDAEKWHVLEDHYFVKSRIKDGTFGSKINPEKQATHMASTRIVGKSYFGDNVDVQKLFDEYAGTGEIELDRNGRRKNIEIIRTNNFSGIAVSINGEKKTNVFKIHHSRKRTHIVPIKRKE